MVFGFTVLLACQPVGEVIVRGLALPVPGPVLGMVLLVAGLAWHGRGQPAEADARGDVARVSEGLLGNLSLLFVPAGVGVIDQFGTLAAQGTALGLAVLMSTPLTLAVTALTFVGVKRLWRGAGSVEPAA